jgi:polysaccharide deacetylase family protein (PEP-CTERM system associated)
MSVDVEDYFQVAAFAAQISVKDWQRHPLRVAQNVERILELFDSTGTRATFFTLGWIAEREPALIRKIAAAGHEIASHGYNHTRVTEQQRDAFREDVSRTKRLLEEISGQPIIGYRAASFSITRDNLWALEVLKEVGYEYSSSVFPVRHDLYGIPDAPRAPFRLSTRSVLELPLTTVRLLGNNFPCAGGGYFRLTPYPLFRWGLRRAMREQSTPCIFYFHPWEIDPDQPRVKGAALKSRFRHYVNLHHMKSRLTRLLMDFKWDRMDRVFGLAH